MPRFHRRWTSGPLPKANKANCKGKNGDGKGKQRSKDAATCSKRDKTGTSAGQCLSDRTCSKCGKKGHRAEKCLSKSSSAPGTGSSLSTSKSELCLWQGWTLFGGLPNKRTKALAAIEDADPPTVSALSLSLSQGLFGSYMIGSVEPSWMTWEVSCLTIDTGVSRTVFSRSWVPGVPEFPTKSWGLLEGELALRRSWSEGSQVVTLDVYQVSRFWC